MVGTRIVHDGPDSRWTEIHVNTFGLYFLTIACVEHSQASARVVPSVMGAYGVIQKHHSSVRLGSHIQAIKGDAMEKDWRKEMVVNGGGGDSFRGLNSSLWKKGKMEDRRRG
ncbi:unnamed protein product [Dovyalis caffra]|uniref:Uncharacterized protein n=1 Tax=Dovyalis caffra TaxID=77055 RepID=A0AAV1SKS2_9ROSI|nr:unnamed protein product [Dovyalis caffra]